MFWPAKTQLRVHVNNVWRCIFFYSGDFASLALLCSICCLYMHMCTHMYMYTGACLHMHVHVCVRHTVYYVFYSYI